MHPTVMLFLIPDMIFSAACQKYRALRKKQALNNGSTFQQQDLVFEFIRMVTKCETIAQKLTKLYLDDYQLTDQHIQHLRQVNWPNITYACFRDNHLGPHSAKILSTFTWANLTAIQVDNNNLGAEGMLYLRQAQWPNLQNINVSHNNIGNEGFLELTRNNTWKKLTNLSCMSNKLNKSHLHCLSSSIWVNLESVDLRSNNISRRGVKELVKCPFANLRALFLNYWYLDDERLIQLSKGKWKLQTICIQSHSITDRGFRFLRYGDWPKLQKISFSARKQERDALRHFAFSNWSTSPPKLYASFSKYEVRSIIRDDHFYQRFQ